MSKCPAVAGGVGGWAPLELIDALFLGVVHFREVHWGSLCTGGQCFVHHIKVILKYYRIIICFIGTAIQTHFYFNNF